MTTTNSSPFMNGTLWLRFSGQAWVKSWVAIKGTRLVIYDSPQDAIPLCDISLTKAMISEIIITSSPDGRCHSHGIVIFCEPTSPTSVTHHQAASALETRSRSNVELVLAAEDAQDHIFWLMKIKKACPTALRSSSSSSHRPQRILTPKHLPCPPSTVTSPLCTAGIEQGTHLLDRIHKARKALERDLSKDIRFNWESSEEGKRGVVDLQLALLSLSCLLDDSHSHTQLTTPEDVAGLKECRKWLESATAFACYLSQLLDDDAQEGVPRHERAALVEDATLQMKDLEAALREEYVVKQKGARRSCKMCARRSAGSYSGYWAGKTAL